MEDTDTTATIPATPIKELLAEIGEQTKNWRYDNRKSLVELSKEANVSDVLISQLEKNELDNTSLKKLSQIAHAMGKKLVIKFD